MSVNNEQFKQNADRILGPRIYRNMDGSMRRDAVLAFLETRCSLITQTRNAEMMGSP